MYLLIELSRIEMNLSRILRSQDEIHIIEL